MIRQTSHRKGIAILLFTVLITILMCFPLGNIAPLVQSEAESGCGTSRSNACEVQDGSIITFTANNWGCGPMENISTSFSTPSFVSISGKENFGTYSKSTNSWIIPGGGSSSLTFVVNAPEKKLKKDLVGELSASLTTSMESKDLAIDKTSDTWSIYLKIGGEVENTDPTYIQPDISVPYDGSTAPLYQFSPKTSPGADDTLSIEYRLAARSYVFLRIYDAEGNLVRNLVDNEIRQAGLVSDLWDGKNDNGEFVPNGIYEYVLYCVKTMNILDFFTMSGRILVDNDTPPVAEISYIKADTPGINQYTIMGTVRNDNLWYYSLTCMDCDPQMEIAHNYYSVEEDVLGVLDASNLPDGEYSILLTAEDNAGNVSTHTFPIVINQTSNLVKVHVDSIYQYPVLGESGYVPTSDEPIVWIEDDLPMGSSAVGNWEWDSTNAYSGLVSHTNNEIPGTRKHYFIHADKKVTLNSHGNIIQYVFLDPSHPPLEILLQFYTDDGDGEHRAYWGENLIPTGGQKGTASLYHMGSLPDMGKWIRLKIPAPDVGLTGKEIKGMSFATYDGKAYWDKTTTSTNYNETQTSSWLPASNIETEDHTITFINYSISEDADIHCSIFDSENRLVKTLTHGCKIAGHNEIIWDGTDSSGSYVPIGRYYFQFESPEGPIESNTYAKLPGDWSSEDSWR